jgi:hypothetical protein
MTEADAVPTSRFSAVLSQRRLANVGFLAPNLYSSAVRRGPGAATCAHSCDRHLEPVAISAHGRLTISDGEGGTT